VVEVPGALVLAIREEQADSIAETAFYDAAANDQLDPWLSVADGAAVPNHIRASPPDLAVRSAAWRPLPMPSPSHELMSAPAIPNPAATPHHVPIGSIVVVVVEVAYSTGRNRATAIIVASPGRERCWWRCEDRIQPCRLGACGHVRFGLHLREGALKPLAGGP
jgi:hypothetical protein